jgi:hypothetical protein
MPSDLVLGPAGQRLLRNVKKLRGRMTYTELSARLADLGRPIATLGLSRLERGTRRVDADDLVALAIALGTTPNRLLLATDAGSEPMPLTPAVTVSARDAWLWATGERALDSTKDGVFHLDRETGFRRENRPHDLQDDYPVSMVMQHRAALSKVSRAVQGAEAAGVPPGLIRQWLDFTATLAELQGEGEDDGAEA